MQPLKRPLERLAHLGRVAPVVGRAGVLLALGADEGAVLDPGDVAGVGEGEVGVRALGVGEALEGAGVDQVLGEAVVLLGRAVAPVDGVGLGQLGDLLDPGEELCVRGRRCGRRSGSGSHSPVTLSHWLPTSPRGSTSIDDSTSASSLTDLQRRRCLLAVRRGDRAVEGRARLRPRRRTGSRPRLDLLVQRLSRRSPGSRPRPWRRRSPFRRSRRAARAASGERSRQRRRPGWRWLSSSSAVSPRPRQMPAALGSAVG